MMTIVPARRTTIDDRTRVILLCVLFLASEPRSASPFFELISSGLRWDFVLLKKRMQRVRRGRAIGWKRMKKWCGLGARLI